MVYNYTGREGGRRADKCKFWSRESSASQCRESGRDQDGGFRPKSPNRTEQKMESSGTWRHAVRMSHQWQNRSTNPSESVIFRRRYRKKNTHLLRASKILFAGQILVSCGGCCGNSSFFINTVGPFNLYIANKHGSSWKWSLWCRLRQWSKWLVGRLLWSIESQGEQVYIVALLCVHSLTLWMQPTATTQTKTASKPAAAPAPAVAPRAAPMAAPAAPAMPMAPSWMFRSFL